MEYTCYGTVVVQPIVSIRSWRALLVGHWTRIWLVPKDDGPIRPKGRGSARARLEAIWKSGRIGVADAPDSRLRPPTQLGCFQQQQQFSSVMAAVLGLPQTKPSQAGRKAQLLLLLHKNCLLKQIFERKTFLLCCKRTFDQWSKDSSITKRCCSVLFTSWSKYCTNWNNLLWKCKASQVESSGAWWWMINGLETFV